METCKMYMDQENPPIPVIKLLAEYDDASDPYEVDMGAIFKTENGFIGVVISGCS